MPLPCTRSLNAPRKLPPPPVNDRVVWLFAGRLIERYGANAGAVAERQLAAASRQRDAAGAIAWLWITAAAQELLKPAPDRGEWIH
jgi:hypothetical protein